MGNIKNIRHVNITVEELELMTYFTRAFIKTMQSDYGWDVEPVMLLLSKLFEHIKIEMKKPITEEEMIAIIVRLNHDPLPLTKTKRRKKK